MKKLMAAVLMMGLMASAGRQVFAAGADEPEAVQILRIEMRKALLGQDASARVTAARAAKLKYVQGDKDAAKDAAPNAEVDLIEAQAAEQTAGLQVKIAETQLNDALKNLASIPARQPASATEVTVLQLELQKAKIAADAAVKIAANRKKIVAQEQEGKSDAGKVADAVADLEAAQANVGLLGLELEAAQVRVDSAVKSTKK